MGLGVFTLACVLEPEGGNQKVTSYIMSGNLSPQMAADILQQLIIEEGIKRAMAAKAAPGYSGDGGKKSQNLKEVIKK